jgi:hypothetical protein
MANRLFISRILLHCLMESRLGLRSKDVEIEYLS